MTPEERAALVALKDAVEAGEAILHPLPEWWSSQLWSHTVDANIGSTDAALALLGAVLPGWWCELRISTRPRAIIGDLEAKAVEQAPTPARALLLAILAALIEQEAQP